MGQLSGEKSMDLREALAALGVTEQTLSQEEKEQLDRDGYLPLPNILSVAQIAQITKRTDELTVLEGEAAGKEVHQEAGTTRLSDLVNKDPVFEICFTHPRVLAAIDHVLPGDLKLSSLNYRSALPGFGHQGLHADWSAAVEPGHYFVCNSIWLLDDFTQSNGATRVIPGSHRSGKMAKDVMADPTQSQPNEVLLMAPAGTVVIFNSHTWHGGTLNRTDRPRRAMHSYFTRRDQTQQLDQKAYIRPETYQRLSPAARFILDV
jgi:ectoine hydroxylase-related dioxygenase (phytanoyl-CoA dioxygenase family)